MSDQTPTPTNGLPGPDGADPGASRGGSPTGQSSAGFDPRAHMGSGMDAPAPAPGGQGKPSGTSSTKQGKPSGTSSGTGGSGTSNQTSSKQLGEAASGAASSRSAGLKDLNEIRAAEGVSDKAEAVTRRAAVRVGDTVAPGVGTAADKARDRTKDTVGIRHFWNGLDFSFKVIGITSLSIVLVLALLGFSAGANLLFKAAFDSSGGNRGENTHLSQGMGKRAIAEFKKAGAAYDVPWPVIASLAAAATETGKFSPYDEYDRAPSRKGIRRASAGQAATVSNSPPPSGVVVPGATRRAFAESMLNAVGARNENSLMFMISWIKWEGNPSDRNNPMATSWNMPGARDVNKHHVKAYPSGDAGLQAGIRTLRLSRYKDVVANLAAGTVDGGVIEDILMKNSYCVGECTPYTQHKISADVARYRTDPKIFARDAGAKVVDVPLGQAGVPVPAPSDGSTTTPPTTAAPPTTLPTSGVGGGNVLVVGDSLCDSDAIRADLSKKLRDKGYNPTLDCLASRPLDGAGLAVIRAKAHTPITSIVVALGTNDVAAFRAKKMAANIDQVMQVADGRPVLWVNVGIFKADGGDAVNAAIADADKKYPNLTVADWKAIVQPGWLGDGIHPKDMTGARKRNDLIANRLGQTTSGAPGAPVTMSANPAGMKVSDFPKVTPPIGGATPTEALGPFLLRGSVVKQYQVNPQNLRFTGTGRPRTATDLVAAELSKIRYRMHAKGRQERQGQDAFWTEVVRQMPVADPRDGNCPLGDLGASGGPDQLRSLVSAEIDRAWSCELTSAPELYTLESMSTRGDKFTSTVSSYEQRSMLTQEALEVAYAFSKWGTEPCDENAQLAGVFPLTKETFDKFSRANGKGRCDPAANIQTAARAFVAIESQKPSTKPNEGGDRRAALGAWAPAAGGWLAMPWALGDDAMRDRLLKDGPSVPWNPDVACLDKVDTAITSGGAVPDCGVSAEDVAQVVGTRLAVLRDQVYPFTAEGRAHDDEAGESPPAPLPEGGGEVADVQRVFALPPDMTPEKAAEYVARADQMQGRLTEAAKAAPSGRRAVPVRLGGVGESLPAAMAVPPREDYARIVVATAADMGGLWEGDYRYRKVADPYTRLAVLTPSQSQVSAQALGGNVGAEVPYAELFNTAARANGMDPRMLAAVAFVESMGFKQQVIDCRQASPKGAKGLMQFMPIVVEDFRIRRNIVFDPCNPEQAIPNAAILQKEYFDKYGSREVAWAAYNGGERDVKACRCVPNKAETKRYIPLIQAKWDEYKAKYPDQVLSPGGGPPVPISTDSLKVAAGPGVPIEHTVVVQGIRVHRSVASQVDSLLNAAHADGVQLSGWGWRDNANQIRLRKAHCGAGWATAPSSSCRPPTARPGASMHERGVAIDFTLGGRTLSRSSPGFFWLKANAQRFGFQNLPSEAWHWSVNGD